MRHRLRTYPLQYGFRSLWATSRTTSCSPSPTPTRGASETPKVDVQQGGDVIHRPTKKVSFVLHVLQSLLRVLKFERMS